MRKQAAIVGAALALGLVAGLLVRGTGGSAPEHTVVLQRVRDMGELRLARHEFSQAAAWESSLNPADWAKAIPGAAEVVGGLTRNRAIGQVNGHVDAGIDFSKAKVTTQGATVVVELPVPQVLEVVVDADPIHHQAGLFWRDNDMASVAEADYRGLLRSAALKAGILDRARRNAEAAVRGLFEDARQDVEVHFRPGSV